MNTLQRVRATLDRALGLLLTGLMGLAVINLSWQVASRYLLGIPSSFTDELARFLLVWIGLFGATYGVGRRLHLAIDLLPEAVDRRAGRGLDRLVGLLTAGFALAVLTVGGGWLVELTASLGQRSPALGIPMALVYLSLPVSGLAMVVYIIGDLFEAGRPDD
jgi:TRAP-type C4-dicarboxylate transport system permease small subunit